MFLHNNLVEKASPGVIMVIFPSAKHGSSALPPDIELGWRGAARVMGCCVSAVSYPQRGIPPPTGRRRRATVTRGPATAKGGCGTACSPTMVRAGPRAAAVRAMRVGGRRGSAARHRARRGVGPGGEPIQKYPPPHTTPLRPGTRGAATARGALGWYRPSVGVPRDVGCCALVVFVAYIFSVQLSHYHRMVDDVKY